MKQVCLMCGRSAADRNLYCQEAACPAEKSPLIFEHGEKLADIEIFKPIIVLRSSTVYKANWKNKPIYVKIAHDGENHTQRLIREATFLNTIGKDKGNSSYFLPQIQLPYPNAEKPYGRVVFRNQLLFYYIFDYVDGEPLSEVLARHQQPWIYHTCSIVTDLASTIGWLQSQKGGMCHLAISPEVVLVNFGEWPDVPTILLLDLGVVAPYADAPNLWYKAISHPAYTAPELLQEPKPIVTYNTDVYGLGLILYEMLIGQPAYPARLLDDKAISKVVREGKPVPMTRSKDVNPVAGIAEKAIKLNPNERYSHCTDMVKELKTTFNKIPGKKEALWRKTDVLFKVAIILLAVALLILLTIMGTSLLSARS